MIDPGLRTWFISAGMPKTQIETALSYFEETGTAPLITSQREYVAARATYVRMDASLSPDELFSPVARYILSLGVQLSEWERKDT